MHDIPGYCGGIAIENNKIIKISCFTKEMGATKIVGAKGLLLLLLL